MPKLARFISAILVVVVVVAWLALRMRAPSADAPLELAPSGLAGAAAAKGEPPTGTDHLVEASQRETRAGEATHDATAHSNAGRTGISFLAVAKESGLPLEHTRFSLSVRQPDESWGEPFATHESGADGKSEFDVNASWAMVLEVQLLVEPFSSQRISIEPLAQGEHREMRVELATAPDLHFWARIVRDEDGARVPFVHAQLVYQNPAKAEPVRLELAADAEALIEIDTASWKESVLLVELEGFAQASARIVPGHETSAKAFELRLSRSARLKVLVKNPAGAALPGLIVRASAAAYELSQSDFWFDDAEHVRSNFEAVSDADGRVTLADLPPRVEIELSVLDGEQLLMRDAVKQRLDPGQEKEVTLVVGGKAALFGHAIDQTGRAVPDQVLWLVKPDPSMGMVFRNYAMPSARTRTDAQGAFEFADIAEGEWWVGPPSQAGAATDHASALAAYGQRVRIPPGAGRFEVTLHLWRGLYISGHVRVSSGEPAGECTVLCNASDIEHTGYMSTKTDAGGAFELGPLCGVEYELRAGGAFQGVFAESPRVLAMAGASDVVLIVERAAILRGVVIDSETNEACDATIYVTQANLQEGMAPSLGSSTTDHKFELSGITAGVWDVSATARNARMATMRVTLVAGETKDITLRVAASVVLTFKNTSATEFYYLHPFSDGIGLELAGVEAGAEQRFNVPPGRISLRISNAEAKTLVVRSVEIAPGASGELAYP